MLLRSKICELNLDSIDMDEAIEALAISKVFKVEYETNQLPIPDWLAVRVEELTREVKSRHRDYLERALKNARARAEALKSREQKVTDVQSEIAELENALKA